MASVENKMASNSLSDLNGGEDGIESYIVQKYIENPLLIGGTTHYLHRYPLIINYCTQERSSICVFTF
jgi:hypothetical protein